MLDRYQYLDYDVNTFKQRRIAIFVELWFGVPTFFLHRRCLRVKRSRIEGCGMRHGLSVLWKRLRSGPEGLRWLDVFGRFSSFLGNSFCDSVRVEGEGIVDHSCTFVVIIGRAALLLKLNLFVFLEVEGIFELRFCIKTGVLLLRWAIIRGFKYYIKAQVFIFLFMLYIHQHYQLQRFSMAMFQLVLLLHDVDWFFLHQLTVPMHSVNDIVGNPFHGAA